MMNTSRIPILRLFAAAAASAVLALYAPAHMEAQGGITITSPASNGQKFKAGPDFATDVMADPWDFGNREDVTLDPAQIDGFANFQVAGGVAGGTLTTAAASGSNSASHFYTLQRP